MWNNVMYVRPSFVTLNQSKTKHSKVKPCAWCIVRLTTNPWIWNWIIVIIWGRLLSIFISMLFCWLGIQFLFNLGNSLHISAFFLI
jgi:hypothetical protein